MNKQTKIILTVLGLCAVVVPVVLLVTLTSKAPPSAQVPASVRDINEGNIQETVAKTAPDLVEPTSTGSAIIGSEASSSAPLPSVSSGI